MQLIMPPDNKSWWSNTPMTYDWKNNLKADKYTSEWFSEIDQRFIYGARLFATDNQPFDRLIPFDQIKGKRVLEIGCGMGLHTELMCKAGATVTAIDITEESITATRTRLLQKGLNAKVICGDAESIVFPSNSFDFIWSWGVIHHSSSTSKILNNIATWLNDSGTCKFMVYNLSSSHAYLALLRHYLYGFWRQPSIDSSLNKFTDGHTARFYTQDQLEDLTRIFFGNINIQTFGQDSDAVPLPRALRQFLLMFVSDKLIKSKANRYGFFLFVTATSPQNICAE